MPLTKCLICALGIDNKINDADNAIDDLTNDAIDNTAGNATSDTNCTIALE